MFFNVPTFHLTNQSRRAAALLGVICAFGLVGPAAAQSFEETLISAYETNPRLLAERARVRETDESYAQAQAEGRLQASASGSYGITGGETVFRQTSPFGGTTDSRTEGEFTPGNAAISLQQPLYQGGRVRALKDQAKAGIYAARENLRAIEQAVLLGTATAYVDVIRDEETARIRRENVRGLTRLLSAAETRFEAGEGTRTDVAQARSRLAAATSGLASADAQLAASRAAFERSAGFPPEVLSDIPDLDIPETVSIAESVARYNNPEINALRYNAQAAEAAVDVAKSAYKPSVSLTGNLSAGDRVSPTTIETREASVLAQVTVPLLSGGLNKSRERAAKAARTRTRLEIRDGERAITQEVVSAWWAYEAAIIALEASEEQAAASELAFDGVELENQVGLRNALDVLDAEQEVLNARLAVAQSRRDADAAKFRLLSAMGLFDAESLKLGTSYYDPAENMDEVSRWLIPKSVEDTAKDAVDTVREKTVDIYDEISDWVEND